MGLGAQLKNLFYNEDAYYEDEESPREERLSAAAEEPAVKQIALVKPMRFEEAGGISAHLMENRVVILNLEDTPKDVACRIIDFVSGSAYAIDGQFVRGSRGCYIATPHDVTLEEDEFNGYYADFYHAKF